MQKQITKAWGEGSIPATKGTYLLIDNPEARQGRLVTAVVVGPGIVKVFDGENEVRQDANARHFGPLPGVERSLAAQERHAATPATAS